MRTPRTSSDPTVPYPQAGPTRIGSPAVAGHHAHPHVPSACSPTVSARDDRPHGNAAVGAIDYTHGGGHHGPRQAPMPRARVHSAMPARSLPMPRTHTGTRPGARHHGTARVRHRPPTPTPRPRPPRAGGPGHLLAVRYPHRPERTLGLGTRRSRQNDHARTRAREHMQQERGRTISARTRAALTTLGTQDRRSMRSTAQRCDLRKRDARPVDTSGGTTP